MQIIKTIKNVKNFEQILLSENAYLNYIIGKLKNIF